MSLCVHIPVILWVCVCTVIWCFLRPAKLWSKLSIKWDLDMLAMHFSQYFISYFFFKQWSLICWWCSVDDFYLRFFCTSHTQLEWYYQLSLRRMLTNVTIPVTVGIFHFLENIKCSFLIHISWCSAVSKLTLFMIVLVLPFLSGCKALVLFSLACPSPISLHKYVICHVHSWPNIDQNG